MPIGRNFYRLTGRFSRNALFLSASALCLAPIAARAADLPLPAPAPVYAEMPPATGGPWISVYGGYLFNESDTVADFTNGDEFDKLGGLGRLDPGDDGWTGGLEVGSPLVSGFDLQASFNAVYFDTDESRDSGGLFFEDIPLGEGEAHASSDFDYQYIDLELGYRPGIVGGNLRLFAGPRFLHAAQDIDYSYDNSIFIPVMGIGEVDKFGNFDHDTELWGIGPRIGAEAGIPLGNSRASLNLAGAGSVIFSNVDHDYDFEFDKLGADGSGDDDLDDSRTVYNLEASAAVSYNVTNAVSFELGYQGQKWWNLTTTLDEIDDGDADGSASVLLSQGDVLVHGPFARITVKLQ